MPPTLWHRALAYSTCSDNILRESTPKHFMRSSRMSTVSMSSLTTDASNLLILDRTRSGAQIYMEHGLAHQKQPNLFLCSRDNWELLHFRGWLTVSHETCFSSHVVGHLNRLNPFSPHPQKTQSFPQKFPLYESVSSEALGCFREHVSHEYVWVLSRA
jgi:hypothetical protein